MAKTIMLNSRFWEDNYISELQANEKLLFLYCLTNPRISLSGIYEVPLRNIALDTGIDTLSDMFKKFEKAKKIAYKEGWLCIINYPKYQNYKSPMIQVALKNEISIIPSNLLDYFISIGYPINTLSIVLKGKGKEQVKDKDKGEESFEKFWNEYPKKIGKAKAKKVFENIKDDLDSILRGLTKWKQTDQWKKDKGQFIPYPVTWLNQERWNDEVEGKPLNNKYERYN